MPIITGGVLGEHGEPGNALRAVMRMISAFAPSTSENDYVVDLGFMSWRGSLGPTPPGIPNTPGVHPWMVGRKQRRFIVQIVIPQGLADQQAVLTWLCPALFEVAQLCREYLPTKSRQYPAESLAHEVEALARHLTTAQP